MAIGLRVAAAQRLVGGPETTLTALAKLEQVLPAPLRRRVTALADAVQPAGIRTGEAVSTEVLGELALACRDHERVRFTYTAASGEVSRRRVEPYTLAPADRHWYLLCWDLERDDWRTFRVDRVGGIEHTRVLFEPRPLTPEQIEEFILVARSWVRTAVETDVVMDLPIDAMRECVRAVGSGRDAEGADRDAVAGGRRRTSARRCTAWRGSRPGSNTRPTSRSPRAASCARRSSGCCGRWMPRRRRRCGLAPADASDAHRETHSETPGSRSLASVGASGLALGSSRRSGRSRAPVHTRQRCGFDSRRRVHFRRAAIPVFTRDHGDSRLWPQRLPCPGKSDRPSTHVGRMAAE